MLDRRSFVGSALALTTVLPSRVTLAQGTSQSTPVFYQSGKLRIQAYLSRPAGAGPFPLVIFNHGSRAGYEREQRTFSYMADLYLSAGYAVLIPERRGYGQSDGATFSEAVGKNVDAKFIERLEAEADDVLAALPYLATLPFVDVKRIAIAGWSFGGIVTMLAIARSSVFKAAIDQAGGALSWQRSAALREALIRAAQRATTPILFMDAENDATTAAVTTLASTRARFGLPYEIKLYGAFTPKEDPGHIAPGHLIFGRDGVALWGGDATRF
ncbi:MAG: alpha/beta fold hydrolase, partial [Candidatus Sulfotelmatobacter sp.]